MLLSFYFHPDLSAGSFRTSALVSALLGALPENSQLEVITTQPNRYSSFSLEAPLLEKHSRLIIHRIPIFQHNSGMLDQSRAFFSYLKGVLGITRNKDYDVVYATSSRLMTASLGALVARQLRCPLYLDIRDIFVDTIKDVLPSRISFFVKPIFSMMERITVRTATRVNLVSAGFLPYFNSRYPGGDFVVFTNGIDDEFVKVQTSCEREESSSLYTVLYAGNMGEGQGLHLIIPQIARHFDGHLRFLCIGDGGRRKQLQDAIEEAGCTNVEITSPVPRSELIAAYQKADVLFLHLNDYDAFRKVLPSKIFEYAALGKPIWAGVAGYSAGFIQDFISNAAVFRPCNVEDAIKAFSSLSMVTKPRKEFVERFAREKIMKALAEDIIFVVRGEVK